MPIPLPRPPTPQRLPQTLRGLQDKIRAHQQTTRPPLKSELAQSSSEQTPRDVDPAHLSLAGLMLSASGGEAPGTRGARREDTPCIRPTSNEGGRDGSPLEGGKIIPARGLSLASLQGRLVELDHGGALSLAAKFLREAQGRGEPAVWVSARHALPHPQDLERWGLDLRALPVIRVAGAKAAYRAVDTLLRSQAFGLCVLDLPAHALLPLPVQTRLLGLARQSQAALLLLCDQGRGAEEDSLGALVSLRLGSQLRPQPAPRRGFLLTVEARKDKRLGPGWQHTQRLDGPPGLP